MFLNSLFAFALLRTSVIAKVSFVAAAASASTSSTSASPTMFVADGSSTTTLMVTARDAQGNLVTGRSVPWSRAHASNAFAAATGTTDASGQYTTKLRASQGQTYSVTANIASVFIAIVPIALRVARPSAATSSIEYHRNDCVSALDVNWTKQSATQTGVLIHGPR